MPLTNRDRFALGAAAAALASWGAGGWLLLSGTPPSQASDGTVMASAIAFASVAPQPSGSAQPGGILVVDVEGAVSQPGIVTLPSGSRVADAILAAGGYARTADPTAAAGALNLAATLSDGQQIYVPRRGETPIAGGTPTGGTGTSGGSGTTAGLVNLNTASPEALEALPGIGPVTTQKIVAGRMEQPFTSLEEMVQRDILDTGQMEEIRDLVTF